MTRTSMIYIDVVYELKKNCLRTCIQDLGECFVNIGSFYHTEYILYILAYLLFSAISLSVYFLFHVFICVWEFIKI